MNSIENTITKDRTRKARARSCQPWENIYVVSATSQLCGKILEKLIQVLVKTHFLFLFYGLLKVQSMEMMYGQKKTPARSCKKLHNGGPGMQHWENLFLSQFAMRDTVIVRQRFSCMAD